MTGRHFFEKELPFRRKPGDIPDMIEPARLPRGEFAAAAASRDAALSSRVRPLGRRGRAL